MQTLSSRSTSRRRWARALGTGATALVAATAIGSAAGAATSPDQCARVRQRQRRRAPGVEYGGAERQHRPDHGQLDVHDAVLEDCVRVGELAGGGRLRHRDRDALEVVQDDHRGAEHHAAEPRRRRGRAPIGPPPAVRRPVVGWLRRGRRIQLPPRLRQHQRHPTQLPRRIGTAVRRRGLHRDRVGQGHRCQRLDDLGVGRRHRSGELRGNQSSSSKSSKSSKTAKPETPKTQSLKITTSGSTTVTSTQSAASNDLAVGDCVTAVGPSATNGAVTASTVRITSTGGATCTSGFAGGGGFFRGGGGGGGGFGGGAPGGGSA